MRLLNLFKNRKNKGHLLISTNESKISSKHSGDLEDLHIDVKADTVLEKGLVPAIIESEKEFREKQKKERLEAKKLKDEKAKEALKNNWLYKILHNLKKAPENFKKVKASPYASLTMGLKARKIIIYPLILVLAYMCFNMVKKVRINGFMGTIQIAFTIGIIAYVIYRIWSTIPAAQKQIDYYKKYPHLVNYCPTDVKESVDTILEKIKKNKEKDELSKDK
jgi:hypothetical protein